jgi:hypothetical protein
MDGIASSQKAELAAQKQRWAVRACTVVLWHQMTNSCSPAALGGGVAWVGSVKGWIRIHYYNLAPPL